MQASYWSKILDSRITRRRGLAAAGAGGLGAGFLAACGGDDGPTAGGAGQKGAAEAAVLSASFLGAGGGSDGPTQGALDKSGLVTLPRDESGNAKPGGIMPF